MENDGSEGEVEGETDSYDVKPRVIVGVLSDAWPIQVTVDVVVTFKEIVLKLLRGIPWDEVAYIDAEVPLSMISILA
jgi:hypothetical protein